MHFYFPFLITPFHEKVKEKVDNLRNRRDKKSSNKLIQHLLLEGFQMNSRPLVWLPESGIVTLNTVDNVDDDDE